MRLSIVDRNGLLSGELRELAERRLRFALSRFDSKIERISVVLKDVNGSRGGIDKSCRIVVELPRVNDVVVTDEDSDIAACIVRASQRVGRAVSRAIERTQSFDRPTPTDLGLSQFFP